MQDKIKKRQAIINAVKLTHIEKWRQSGLTMSAYAREAKIPISSLSKWVRSENKVNDQFKPLLLSPAKTINQDDPIEIIVGDYIKIRLQNTTDSSIAINIIKGLMRCN